MKKLLIGLLCAALLLAGCSQGSPVSAPASAPETTASDAPAAESSSPTPEKQAPISRPALDEEVLIDPPFDFNPDEMSPRDFGEHFLGDYPTEVSSYLLAEGTDVENEVTVIKGAEKGPTVYIVAGLHGDEIAGWMTGNLLKKVSIKAGELRILSPANRWGASAQPRTRYITEDQDLNRNFPGSADGTMAQRFDHAVYTDIEAAQPVFLFDLHEARINKKDRDFLGSSLIYTSLDKMSDMYLDMLLATENGE
ncbi:MAG: succinylglutamate desuccinylase/aspartoacylase family protein, partial [Oscillospiraceae bacterium]